MMISPRKPKEKQKQITKIFLPLFFKDELNLKIFFRDGLRPGCCELRGPTGGAPPRSIPPPCRHPSYRPFTECCISPRPGPQPPSRMLDTNTFSLWENFTSVYILHATHDYYRPIVKHLTFSYIYTFK